MRKGRRMSETIAVADGRKTGKVPSGGKFERFLTLWVTLCIIVGIGLGQAVPGVFHALGAATVAVLSFTSLCQILSLLGL